MVKVKIKGLVIGSFNKILSRHRARLLSLIKAKSENLENLNKLVSLISTFQKLMNKARRNKRD